MGRDSAGPPPLSQRAALTPPGQLSCLQQPCYHPTLATAALCPGPGTGATRLQHSCLYLGSPSKGPGLGTPAQPRSPHRCHQWRPDVWAEREHPSQPERGQALSASPEPATKFPSPEGAGTRTALLLSLRPRPVPCPHELAPAVEDSEARSSRRAGGWAVSAGSCYCINTHGREATTGKANSY